MSTDPDMMDAIIKMLFGLVFVLGILMVVWYLARRFAEKTRGGPQGRQIQILANTCIGIKKTISLVRVPGAILVLGITQDRISCLAQLRPEDWVADDNGGAVQRAPGSFLSHLKSEMTGFYKKGSGDGQPV